MSYDSTEDTKAHINRVRELITNFTRHMANRAFAHDYSKLQEPEKSIIEAQTETLKGLTYGSDEYKKAAGMIGEAHYPKNRHHPEYHAYVDGVLDKSLVEDGTAINRMNLLDIVEMLLDWKAASERHANGDIIKSIEMNQSRFGYSDDLKNIMLNTARELNW